MSDIYQKYYCSKPAYVKIAINAGIFALLAGVFFVFLKNTFFFFCIYEEGVYLITDFINLCSEKILNLFPWFNVEHFGKCLIDRDCGGVILDRGCIGRNTMLAFVAFIVVLPGVVWKKAAYCVFGLFAIVFFNILRICSLLVTLRFCPQYFDFNHEYLFKYVLYLAVFLLWVFWLKKINKTAFQ